MNRKFKEILLGVITFHVLGLIVLAFWTFFTPPPPPLQKISVRTFKMKNTVAMNDSPPQAKPPLDNPQPAEAPEPQQPVEKTEPTPPPTKEEKKILPEEKKPTIKKPLPPKKTKEPVKKEIKKVAEKAKKTPLAPSKAPSTPPKEETPRDDKKDEERRSLLQKAKEKLNKTTTSIPTQRSSSYSLPDEIEPLSVETLVKGPAGKDAGYVATLVSHLKQQMTLPERGDVELLLTLNRSGKIVKVAVTKSHSLANKNYAQKKLLELSYPPFDGYFDKMETFEFEITLRGT